MILLKYIDNRKIKDKFYNYIKFIYLIFIFQLKIAK